MRNVLPILPKEENWEETLGSLYRYLTEPPTFDTIENSRRRRRKVELNSFFRKSSRSHRKEKRKAAQELIPPRNGGEMYEY